MAACSIAAKILNALRGDMAAGIKSQLSGWARKKLGFEYGSSPPVRVLLYPSSEENPYVWTLKKELEELGVRVAFLQKFDLWELSRLRPFYEVLHIVNVRGYHNPLESVELRDQINKLSRHVGVLAAARAMGYKIFYTTYNHLNENWENSIERAARKLIWKQTHKVFCLSQSDVDKMRKVWSDLPRDRFAYLPHHLLSDYYDHEDCTSCKQEAMRQLELKPEGRVFLAFGAVHPYKGLIDLIPIFGREPFKKHTLIIAGSPSNPQYARTIKGLAEPYPNIKTYVRYIARQEVHNFFKVADFFVIPPKRMSNIGSAMLALSFGLPIIAPQNDSLNEVFTSRASLLYEYDGAKPLRHALKRALEVNPETYRHEARRISKVFSVDKVTRRLVNYYLDAFPGRERIPEEETYEI